MKARTHVLFPLVQKVWFTLLLGIGCLAGVKAEVQFFDYSNGLSNEKVNIICKEKNGLMWIGTDGGLNQFNGYEFVEIPFFKDHGIKVMFYDSLENILWVGSNKGLFLFNVKTHQVLNASGRMADPAVAGIATWQNEMFVAFRCGDIFTFSKSGHVKRFFSLLKSPYKKGHGNHINGIAVDGNGYMYLHVHNDTFPVISLNLKSGATKAVPGLSEDIVWNISSGNGKCIMTTENNTVAFYSEGKNTKPEFLTVPDFHEDDPIRVVNEIDGVYFISFKEHYGRYTLDARKKQWIKLERTNLQRTLKSKNIRLFYLDNDNVLWLGTTKGLIKSSIDVVYPFHHVLHEYDKSASVRQIVAGHPHQLFVATYDGIYDYDTQKNTLKLLDNAPKEVGFPLYSRALYYDNGEYLYAGTESNTNYFYRYNLKTKQYEGRFFTEDRRGVRITSVFSMIRDDKGIMWLATDVGLASYNPRTNAIEIHSSGKFSVGNRRLMYIQHSRYPGKFWTCGRGGAFLVDAQNGVERSYDFSAVFGASDIEYLFVSDDAKHNMWLTTQKYGIVMLPANSNEPLVINTSDGLASNEVYSVLWENDDIAWISTSNGLSRYDIKKQSFYNYRYENGIADDEFNQHSFYRASDTLFYLGGINGVTYFNPKQFRPATQSGSIFLANITRWSSEDKKKQISFATDDIVMNPTDYLITLHFGLNDYSKPAGNSYFYKINNLNKNWLGLGAENSLTLNGLAPGEYQIRVKGVNKLGIESENTLSFSILVKEYYYKTGWFYVLLSIVLIALVYFYFRWRINRITQRQLLRTQISSNLHDEVGSLLTQIVISTDNALYAIHDVEEKNRRLAKISSLSRNAINTMSDVLWSIDSRNDFVGNLTDRMREHAELMAAEKGIELNFEFSNTRVLKGIDPQVRQQLYLIYKETIHNIIKHSKATLIKVKFKTEGKGFELCVSNNNHSEPQASAKMQGQGINNIHMRAKKIKADCGISSEDGWFVVLIQKK